MSVTTRAPGGAGPAIIVADCGIDACYVPGADGGHIVVSPNQTFGSAVHALAGVMPTWDEQQVRAALRGLLPAQNETLDDVLPGHSRRWDTAGLHGGNAFAANAQITFLCLLAAKFTCIGLGLDFGLTFGFG